MLKITNLTKIYPKSVKPALSGLNLETKPGEILGLVGSNGAGKTTMIKCVIGVLPFEQGSVEICGFDLAKEPLKAKFNMGFVPDDHAVFETLTCREYVNFIADIYKVSAEDRKERAEAMLEMFSLKDAYDKMIYKFSHGMKQKTAVMGALIHKPKLWILDEPMIGLDPQSIYQLKKAIKKHRDEGSTVVFSTHLLDVAEKLCDRVAIISQGNLCGIYDMRAVREEMKTGGRTLEEIFVGHSGAEVSDK